MKLLMTDIHSGGAQNIKMKEKEKKEKDKSKSLRSGGLFGNRGIF